MRAWKFSRGLYESLVVNLFNLYIPASQGAEGLQMCTRRINSSINQKRSGFWGKGYIQKNLPVLEVLFCLNLLS